MHYYYLLKYSDFFKVVQKQIFFVFYFSGMMIRCKLEENLSHGKIV